MAFCIYYVWGETMFARWVGFDYDRLAGAAEYFNVLFYSLVKRAPEVGARRIHAAGAKKAAKARRGAELAPLWLVDLTEDSPLADAADRIRRHNRSLYERWAADASIARQLVPEDEWRAFC